MAPKFRRLGIDCVHCGQELRAARRYRGLELKGNYDLEYRHLDMTKTCTVTRTFEPKPFDNWRASAAYDNAG